MISERWPPTFGPCNVQRKKNSYFTVFSLFCLERTLHKTHETRPVCPAVVKRLLSAGFVPAAAAAASRRTNTFNLAIRHTHYNVTETDPSSGPPALYVPPLFPERHRRRIFSTFPDRPVLITLDAG